MNLSSLGIGQRPLVGVGGFANEPAFSYGDWVRNFILSPPFAWRWNRNIFGFPTTAGVQDYTFAAGWVANNPYPAITLLADSNGNVQQTGGGTSGPSVPTWNPTTNGTTTDGTVTWVNLGPSAQVGAITDFGWLEHATITDATGEAYELEVSLDLGNTTTQERPFKISAQRDDGYGDITFRLFPAPPATLPVLVSYQRASAKFQSLTDTWYPIPDYFSYMYNTGFLAKAYEYVGDEKFASTLGLFFKQVVSASEGLSDSQKNLFLDHVINSQRELQNVQRGGQ